MFSRKPHYELPAEVQDPTLTLLLQQPLKLHDLEVIHITFVREELAHWLEKGGEIRGKLNGIGFAQQLNMDVDTSQHLVVRDVSLQGSRLSLPGSESRENMPAEIRHQLQALDDKRALRRSGVKSVHDIGDDDWDEEDVDDEDGPEIIYVRD